jgi:DNA-binding transcriptional regulator YiaG
MRDNMKDQKTPRAKPYPRFCSDCGQNTVEAALIPYRAEILHDDAIQQFDLSQLPVDRCSNCHEIFFTNLTDEHLTAGLRAHLGLLQPSEIAAALTRLGISEAEFARQLGVAPELLSGWASGIRNQPKAIDNLMRVFLAFSNVREALRGGNRASIPFEGAPSIPPEASQQIS